MALTQINPQEKKKKPSKLETFAKFAQMGAGVASMGKDMKDLFKGSGSKINDAMGGTEV